MPQPPPTETLTLPHPAPVRGPAPGAIVGGDLRLVAPIGAGGMGEVWLAVDTGPLGRSCAVKFLADPAPSARDRFLAEARIMATLRHPHIVSVNRFGVDAPTGLAYYVMDEFLPTPADTRRLCRDLLHCPPPAPLPSPAPLSLARLLDGGKTLPEATVRSIALQLLSAIEAAHALSPPVIHRDIKPSNILFAPDGRTLLADFGIAKRLPVPPPPNAPFPVPSDPSPTLPGATPGTPAYAAPEQLAGRPLTPAADFYSFGVVLYRAFTGGIPSPSAVLPADIAPHVSRAWQKLFAGLLDPDPAARLVHPDTIHTLLDEIAHSTRPRLRPAFYAALFLLLRPHPSPTPDGRSSADQPLAPAPAAQAWLRRHQDAATAAKTWTARYLQALQTLLPRVVDPTPDADNTIHVGPDQILLSGDVSLLSPPPTILLNGGTLLVSPGRAALQTLCNDCAYYLQNAPDTAPLPDFLPAITRDTLSAPIRIGPDGGTLNAIDALESALGLSLPDSLSPATGRWPDRRRYDLLVKSPILPADGLPTATLRIPADAPDVTFTSLPPDGRIHHLRSPVP